MYSEKEMPSEVKGDILDAYLAKGWFRMRDSIFTVSHLVDYESVSLHQVSWLRFQLAHIDEKNHTKKSGEKTVNLKFGMLIIFKLLKCIIHYLKDMLQASIFKHIQALQKHCVGMVK